MSIANPFDFMQVFNQVHQKIQDDRLVIDDDTMHSFMIVSS